MKSGDWYPRRLNERAVFHAGFAARAVVTGVADGLTAAIVNDISVDADTISKLANYNVTLDAFAKGYTQYMRLLIEGPLNSPMPPLPVPPDPIDIIFTALPAIEPRTRRYVRILRAHADYTRQKGKEYGFIASARPEPGIPGIVSLTPLVGGEMGIRLYKAGYKVLSLTMQRHEDPWIPIGISQTAAFRDRTPNAVPGSPEERRYRVQGYLNNAPTGPYSDIVSVVTWP